MKKYEIDMCNGPLLKKIIIFSVPLVLSGILQLFYNAADIIVVGRFGGNSALAAVGATASLTHLIVNLFLGLSIGSSVVAAQYIGAQDNEKIHKTVHTTIALSLISGLLSACIAIIFARKMLTAMDTPADIIDKSVLYLRIYFSGIPATMLYNFGSSILRAMGDTKRPLYFLSISGIINVSLNLFFVIVLKWMLPVLVLQLQFHNMFPQFLLQFVCVNLTTPVSLI